MKRLIAVNVNTIKQFGKKNGTQDFEATKIAIKQNAYSLRKYLKLTLVQHCFTQIVDDFISEIDDEMDEQEIKDAFYDFFDDEEMSIQDNYHLFIGQYLTIILDLHKYECDMAKYEQIINEYQIYYSEIITQIFKQQRNELLEIIIDKLYHNDKKISFSNAKVGDTFSVKGNYYSDTYRRTGCFAIINGYYMASAMKVHSELAHALQEQHIECNDTNSPNCFGYIIQEDNKIYALINIARTEKYTKEEIKTILTENQFRNKSFSGYFTVNESCKTITGIKRFAKRI